MPRKTVTTGTVWENEVGYARAVRSGNHVYVSGTTSTDPLGNLVGEGDPYLQTMQTLRNIVSALEAAGATINDVVRTRMYVTDISNWEKIGKAHGEMFGNIHPASTMVEVNRLIDPRMLVEIEADALIPEDQPEAEPYDADVR